MSQKPASWWKNIVLMLVSLCATFGLAEVALRLSHRVPTNSLRSPDLETLDAQPGLFQPNQDFIDRLNPALPYRIRTNSLGFRGPDFSLRKPAGHLRILCVGDSYTFGPCVDEDRTVPGVLARLLRDRTPPVEVINGGASGFTIVDERRFLEERALRIDPDFVLLFFSQNDIRDLGQKRATIDLMRDHAATKSMPLVGVTIGFLQRTAVFNGLQKAAAILRTRRRAAQAPVLGRNEPSHWQTYREHLEATKELLSRRGIRLMLIEWPTAQQISEPEAAAPESRLGTLAAEVGVPYLDLTPTIRDLSRKGAKAFLLPLDGHPTGDSYEAAALAIRTRLLEDGVLAASAGQGGVQN